MVDYYGLKKAFKGDIMEPGSPGYAEASARWATNAERKARYIVSPKDEGDVALALKFATSNAVPLAIKCGGHNPSGASSVENGLVIDLSIYLNTVKVDPDKKLAYVGGGALWDAVDKTAIEHGLAVVGGTVNHTGVGGLTLAGGFGYLSGRQGLVIDNLAQITIVIADGSVLTASEASNQELFWGCRGGGSNFGVVTEFVFNLHPQRKTVFAGPIVFPASMLRKVVEVIDDWFPNIEEDEAILFGITRAPSPNWQPIAILFLFYNGSEEAGRANFKRFYDLGPVTDNARQIPYEQLNGLAGALAPHGRNYYMGGSSLRSKVSSHALITLDQLVSFTAKHPSPTSTLPPYHILVGYELYSLKKICAVPADATAFRSRGPQTNIVITAMWTEDLPGEGLAHARKFVKDLTKLIENTAERLPRENENHLYGNHVTDASEMPERARQLWGDNYPRLQRLKKKYDPNIVFNRWFPINPSD